MAASSTDAQCRSLRSKCPLDLPDEGLFKIALALRWWGDD